MRIEIKIRNRIALARYAVVVDGCEADLRQDQWWALWRRDRQWRLAWPLSDDVLIRLKWGFRQGLLTPWSSVSIRFGEETICRSDWNPDATSWQCDGTTLCESRSGRCQCLKSLVSDAGEIQGCWRQSCFGARGVIRSSLSMRVKAAIAGIICANVAAGEWRRQRHGIAFQSARIS